MSGKRKPSPEFLSSSPPSSITPSSLSKDNPCGKKTSLTNKIQNVSGKTGKDRPQKQKNQSFDKPKKLIDLTLSPSSFDYEQGALSPDASSNASSEDPVYIRTPGFQHHAQEIQRPKVKNISTNFKRIVIDGSNKKKKGVISLNNVTEEPTEGKDHGNFTRVKPKKEPLPMKLRALPQSFWQQPNQPSNLSPGIIYPVLPPLSNLTREDSFDGGRSWSPHDDTRAHHRIVSVANTDLLFSLFREVEEEEGARQGEPKITVVRRGRPKKPPSSVSSRIMKDEDPYLINTATESILPLIPDRSGSVNGSRPNQGQQILAMVSLKEGDKSVSLPSLSVDHNYPQLLSELVMKL